MAFPWVPDMDRITVGWSGWQLVGGLATQYVFWALAMTVSVTLGHALLGRRVAVALWLPVAWGLAEVAQLPMLAVTMDAWLVSQWEVDAVLRGVGHLGWWPTLLVCLAASAGVGQALAERRWRVAAPALLAAGLWLLPPLPTDANRALSGVAAVHTPARMTLPHRLPPDAEIALVVWPEGIREYEPVIAEGPARGRVLRPAMYGSDATHLMGMGTRRVDGTRQNQLVVMDAAGRVLDSRAKRLLFPVAEREFLGVGADNSVPGVGAATLQILGRAIIPLICGEVMSRGLVAEGREGGGELLVVAAGDHMMTSERALRQLLAVQVLRSAEFGVPSVRASYGGSAAVVGADGAVLVRSGTRRSGLVYWTREGGGRDADFWGEPMGPDAGPRAQVQAPIAVLYAAETPWLRPPCPEEACSYYTVEGFVCGAARARAVVVAGHGGAPEFLGRPAAEVAAAVRCFEPELIVVDTCWGASSALLGPLADLGAEVVAAPYLVPGDGLEYGLAFFGEGSVAERAAAVSFQGKRLLRGRVDAQAMAAALDEVAAMDAAQLNVRLARRMPPQVLVELGEAGPMLVPVEWSRVRPPGSATPRAVRALPRPLRRRVDAPPAEADPSAGAPATGP
ncbi:MAG: hypothetical protein R3F39_24850 [Myxococcota bacterium]